MIEIHCGIKESKTEKYHVKTAYNKLGLAQESKTDNDNVLIFRIVPRDDDNLNDYAIKVNKTLRGAFSKRNIAIIDNENKNPRCNCNRYKLHLNERATNLLIENVLFRIPVEING